MNSFLSVYIAVTYIRFLSRFFFQTKVYKVHGPLVSIESLFILLTVLIICHISRNVVIYTLYIAVPFFQTGTHIIVLHVYK